MSHVPLELSSLVLIERYNDLSLNQMVYIKSKATRLIYKCKIVRLNPVSIGDLKIRLTDVEYERYIQDGGYPNSQAWYRDFRNSDIYLYNDENDLDYWKGK